tara:strand:+ start:129 stop:485 length:357 start_codon:yes stop_codon:yes gene_type:complete
MNKRILEINKLRNRNLNPISKKLFQDRLNNDVNFKIHNVLSGLNFDDSIKQTKKRIKIVAGVVGVAGVCALIGVKSVLVFACYGFVFWLISKLHDDTTSLPASRSARRIYLDTKKEGK